jgi:hypothetical protein
MAVVDAFVIENVSGQIIKILYEQAPDRGFVVSDETFSPTQHGLMQIGPQKQVTVQVARVNVGQVFNFEAKGLVKVTRTRI